MLDANLEELMQRELRLVQTLVQLMDSPVYQVPYQATSVLQILARNGESQLPLPKDILFIPRRRTVSVGNHQGQLPEFPPSLSSGKRQ